MTLIRQLGQLEAVIMDRVWSYPRPVTVREMFEDLRRERPIAYTTVLTVMDNLHRKGLVTRKKIGRAYHYQASQTKVEYAATVMGEVLARSSDRTATMLYFLEQMSPEDVSELRDAMSAEYSSDEVGDS